MSETNFPLNLRQVIINGLTQSAIVIKSSQDIEKEVQTYLSTHFLIAMRGQDDKTVIVLKDLYDAITGDHAGP